MTQFPLATTSWQNRLSLFSVFILILGLFIHPLGDPDLYIHLRDGRHWLASGLKVGFDPFSYLTSDQPFDKIEPLFKVLLYLLWSFFGLTGLIITKALIMTSAVFMLGGLVYKRSQQNWLVTFILCALALLAPNMNLFPVRPFIFTYLFLIVILWLFELIREEGWKKIKWLWSLPILTLVWSNLHPGFLVVFGYLAAFIIELLYNWWQRNQKHYLQMALQLTLISITTFLTGLINPMGIKLYTYVLHHMASSEFMSFILEWQPPTLVETPWFFLLIGLAGLSILFRFRHLTIADILTTLIFGVMALKAYRNIPLFIIVALPLLAQCLSSFNRIRTFTIKWPQIIERFKAEMGIGIIIMIIVIGIIFGSLFRLGEIKHFYPKAALHWIMTHAIKGNLLSHDIWGGYIGWMTAGKIKIFMDGRLELYGENIYRDYRRMIWGDSKHGLALLKRYNIKAILVSPKNDIKLYQLLWRSNKWSLVYWDHVSQLYCRHDAKNQALIQAHAYHTVDPKQQPFYHPEKPEQALAEINRAITQAPHSFLPLVLQGELLLRQQQLGAARASFEKVLTIAPNHATSRINLGHLYLQSKQLQSAEKHFRHVIDQFSPGPLYAKACHGLAVTLIQQPVHEREGKRYAKKAYRLLPDWKPIQMLMERIK